MNLIPSFLYLLYQFRKQYITFNTPTTMRKKKLPMDHIVSDSEYFEPSMLITLQNQKATQKMIEQNRKRGNSIDRYLPSHSSQRTIFSHKSSGNQNSLRQQQTLRNAAKREEANMCSPPPEPIDHPLSQKKLKKKGSDFSQLTGTVLFNKQRNLLNKVEQLKQNRSEKAQKMQASIFANTNQLSNVLKIERKKSLARNFIKKTRKKKIGQLTYLEQMHKLQSERSIFEVSGCQIHQNIINIFKVFQILFTFILIFFNSVLLVYREVLDNDLFTIRMCALVFFFLDFIVSMTTTKKVEGKIIKNLGQIWQCLGKQKIIMDIANIIILLIDVSAEFYAMNFIRLFVLVKMPLVLKTLEEIQIKLITNSQNDKYWSLVKIMLFNFCFAHILAIILSAMADISPSDNWMTKRQIYQAQWYQKYVWAYYWGTNIMLTVGFGDITASNYRQALCLIFIQTVSCVVLAYNVSCVGDLIMNIKSKDHQKKNQIKLFRKITESSPVSTQLNWKITNFIQESINLKKNFNYEEEEKFIVNLPKYLKYDFLKESNKSVFNQLPFFQFLMEKTIYNLAEKIEMFMAHPQQIIRNRDDDFNLWILRSGEVGLTCHKRGSDMNGDIIDKISVKGSQPFILSLNFITKQQLPFQIKSLQYSSFYFLPFEKLISTLKENYPDFLYYAFNRDKIKNIPDEFQVYRCHLCKDRFHYKFDCPLIHHIPNRDKIVFSHIRSTKFSKMPVRTPYNRKGLGYNAFAIFKFFKLRKYEDQNSSYSNYTPTLLGQTGRNHSQGVSMVFDDDFLSSKKIITKSQKVLGLSDGINDLKQFISGEIGRILLVSEDADPIWQLQSDSLMDFHSYFQADNPKNIVNKIEEWKKKRLNSLSNKK